jgi:hypothetical protein
MVKKLKTFSEEKDKVKICSDTAKIFEKIKNVGIDLTFNKGYNRVIDKTNYFQINVAKTETQSSKTSFERSLSQIVFPSAKMTFEQRLVNSDLTSFIRENDLYNMRRSVQRIFDILESVRVESNYGMIYHGAKERFEESDKLIAKSIEKDPIQSPFDALYQASLGLYDKVNQSEFSSVNNYVSMIKNTGNKATIIATEKFVNEIVKPWYLAKCNIQDPMSEPQTQPDENQQNEGDDEENKGESEFLQNFDDIPFPEVENDNNDSNNNDSDNEDSDSDSNSEGDDSNSEGNVDIELSNFLIDSKNKQSNCNGGYSDISEDETIEEQKSIGIQDIETIENKLEELQREQKEVIEMPYYSRNLDNIIEINKDIIPNSVQYDKFLAKKLQMLFTRFKTKPSQMVSDSGNDIDIDLFIKNKLEGNVDFILDDTTKTGFAVVIGVDCSGSMGNGNMQQAKNLCATLYKSFDGIPNVDITVIGWTSISAGMAIITVKSFDEVGRLRASSGTPFEEATLYCIEYMKKLQHRHKLFFQITDGDISDISRYCIQKINGSPNINSTVIQIGYSKRSALTKAFGKQNHIMVNRLNDNFNSKLIKQIVQRFMSVRMT